MKQLILRNGRISDRTSLAGGNRRLMVIKRLKHVNFVFAALLCEGSALSRWGSEGELWDLDSNLLEKFQFSSKQLPFCCSLLCWVVVSGRRTVTGSVISSAWSSADSKLNHLQHVCFLQILCRPPWVIQVIHCCHVQLVCVLFILTKWWSWSFAVGDFHKKKELVTRGRWCADYSVTFHSRRRQQAIVIGCIGIPSSLTT